MFVLITRRSAPASSVGGELLRLPVSARPVPAPGRVPRVAVAAGRCLAVAALTCWLTRPLFHVALPTSGQLRPTGASVDVTAEVARRLSTRLVPPDHAADRVLWAGWKE